MKVLDNKTNKQRQALRNGLKPVTAPINAPVKPTFKSASQQRTLADNNSQNQIISGYFVQDKSYKEMAISRLNTSICLLLAFLVSVCVVSYYFVTIGEIELNKIRKETLTLNYDNEEMQNKLDNMQSYFNVDETVSKTNILQRAKQVMELPAANLPSVNYENKKTDYSPSWSMGY